MDKNYFSISMRLAYYRKLMNLNQAQMGEKLGVTQSHYSKQESGLKGISYQNLKCFEKNGGDPFFLITGEHRTVGFLDQYLEETGSAEERSQLFGILAWAAGVWGTCLGTGLLTERTGKCMRLLQNYSEDLTVWENIRRVERRSQEEMAGIFDINIKRYRKIEKGYSMPDAEILQTLYEKMQYSPLLVLDQKKYYLDELNRVWALLQPEWRRETERLVGQARKLIRLSEENKKEMDGKK